MSKILAKDVLKAAKEVFCNGIWVKCDHHPCGYDWISFEDYDGEDGEEGITLSDISGGIYEDHPFEYMTLQEILDGVGEHGFCFERGQEPWCS